MKKIGLLGATGSIGENALNVIRRHKDKFSVVYLTANQNVSKLTEAALEFRPQAVIIADESKFAELKNNLKDEKIKVLSGYKAIVDMAAEKSVDIVLNAIVGSKGMEPTVAAIKSGIDVALSNKESLVMAGDHINRLMAETGAKLFPVDSEHSAIWQSLVGENPDDIKKLILTGSGGPFRHRELSTFDDITVKEALAHPNWSMGAKITIDSATMMNKGLEVIEAYHLFKTPVSKIDVLIHPQSIIHSMVQFSDTSIKAQLGIPDMKIPIQYALSYPERFESNWEDLDFVKLGSMSFFEPDFQRFPSIKLAMDVLETGGSYPAVLNVANEQAVYLFLKEKIKFTDISRWVNDALEDHKHISQPDMEDILQIEKETLDYIKRKEEHL